MIKLPKTAAPPAEAGKTILYVSLDGVLHAINENGQEVPLSGGSSGALVRVVANDIVCNNTNPTHPDLRLDVTAGDKVIIDGILWCDKQNGQITLNVSVPSNSISHLFVAAWSSSYGGSPYVMDGAAWPQNVDGYSWTASALPGCAYTVALEIQLTVSVVSNGTIALGVSDESSSGGLTLMKGSYLRFAKA